MMLTNVRNYVYEYTIYIKTTIAKHFEKYSCQYANAILFTLNHRGRPAVLCFTPSMNNYVVHPENDC